MDNSFSFSQSLKWKIPIFVSIMVLLFLVIGGIVLFVLQRHETRISAVPPGWNVYNGGTYLFAYPPSWKLKIGFDFKSDVAVYDPKTKKRWIGKEGATVDWPVHYVDIVSVTPNNMSASDMVDSYEQSWQVSDSQIGRQTLIKNGLEYELYGLVGESTVHYQNVAISNGKFLALLESSITSWEDTSLEKKIMGTFQFK